MASKHNNLHLEPIASKTKLNIKQMHKANNTYTKHGAMLHEFLCVFSCHGWILYVGSDTPFLLNPITTTSVGLAYLNLSEKFASLGSGAMSAPPSDPKCTFLLIDEDDAILYRVQDDRRVRLSLPLPEKSPRSSIIASTTVFSGGRFYCVSSKCCFYVIDPVPPQPLVRQFKMNTDEIPREQWANFLVESDGEVLLAVTLCDPSHPDREVLSGFQVFRPRYSENKWVRVRSIGDRALFIHQFCCFSLSASGVGCKKNCIYHP
ncbi:uncharacterized protein LOC109847919 [Asparagus officinalis]|uniref:uncharacterized protein LOC109847919 n=1 Tax=Asparagus officinalis TaxID=4686 RepID=UPI00098E0A4E|nr:uncharacterized protein LOC109847919 [Asparagus officinalis]